MDLKQRYIAKKWLSFFNKLAQPLVWLRLYYERWYANARNIQEVIKPHGWCDDFMDRFEELMDEAPDEATRKKFEKLMMEMR